MDDTQKVIFSAEKDLLVKEVEMARAAALFHEDHKYKMLNLNLTVFSAWLAFTLKGDLPQHAYLVLSLFLVLGGSYFQRLSFRQMAANGALLIAERKVELWSDSRALRIAPADLQNRLGHLTGSSRKLHAIVVRWLVYICLVFAYFLFAYMGLSALAWPFPVLLFGLLMFAFLAGATVYDTWKQNASRKRRYAESFKSIDPTHFQAP